MISSHDRSGWFGASDTSRIMGNWSTKTFESWWLEKMGLVQNTYASPQMMAGTAYEHRILDFLGVRRRDRQIKIYPLRLRVNLDGEDTGLITEVKTYGGVFRVSQAYRQQCQIETLAGRKPCRIVAYRLESEDYTNYFNPVDPDRLSLHPIDYDPEWVERQYSPRLWYLRKCLVKGVYPRECDIEIPRGPSWELWRRYIYHATAA